MTIVNRTRETIWPAAWPGSVNGRTGWRLAPGARLHTDRYCCAGQFAHGCSPARTWPIDYARVFNRAEPYAYSWSGDDATSVFTCAGGCGYRITFGVTPALDSPP